MPPLPTLWDPAGAVDKLPQPFRMIDKILAEIVEQVVDLIGKREQQRKLEEASKVNLTFAPHAVLEVPPDSARFLPIGIAGLAAVALPDGELRVYSARDSSTSFSDRTHTTPVTALEAGFVVPTSGRLLAAASRSTLSVYEVDVKSCAMTLLVAVPLPTDPDDPAAEPVRLYWSHTLSHLAVCFGSGALVLYSVRLPVPNVSFDSADAFLAMHLSVFGPTRLEELIRLPVATVRAFCLGSPQVGRSHLVWQLQQRPDKSPFADRYHKNARGAYVWWHGASRLLLLDLNSLTPTPIPAASSPLSATPTTDSDPNTATPGPKPVATSAKSLNTKSPGATATTASSDPLTATLPPHGEPAGPPSLLAVAPRCRDWLLPHNFTAAAATTDHKTLAWGLADGSVVIWDDRGGCGVKVLPRLHGSITALGWVNGVAHKLMCASETGEIFIADILKPEDSSAQPYRFPQAVHQITFLPSEPFALCICRGSTTAEAEAATGANSGGAVSEAGGSTGDAAGPHRIGTNTLRASGDGGSGSAGILDDPPSHQRPRIFWYNVLDEKPVAELMGPKAGQSFGLACCASPAPPPTPHPPTDNGNGAAKASRSPPPSSRSGTAPPSPQGAAGSTSSTPSPAAKQAVISVLNAMGAAVTSGPRLVPVTLALPPGVAVSYPALSLTDTYLVAGGDVVDKVVPSRFLEEEGAVPLRVGLLYMYKLDALLRHLMPEDETSSRLGKVVLDRLLADLEAPKTSKRRGKRVTMDVEDPDAPKLPSSMRKPDPFDPGAGPRTGGRAANRHITFGTDVEDPFNDTAADKKDRKEMKVYPKETKKGLALGPEAAGKDRRGPDGKPRLAPLDLEKAKEAPSAFSERSQSPPWHHTNPLARIHPDWEEAPVLARVMDRIGSKSGGRKRRDKRLDALMTELMAKYSKEAGVKPNLLVT